jgi:hypothetical protein
MKPIHIEFIPQSDQRYDTVGDYFEDDDAIHFHITAFPNSAYSWAIMLHELTEKFLKDRDGVTDAEVDVWDLGPGAELDDPGLSPAAPYHPHHMMADSIEREFILFAGEDWIEYEGAIEALFPADEETPDVS